MKSLNKFLQILKQLKEKMMKKNIELLETNVLKAYNGADKSGKDLLATLVGDQVNFNQKITDKVKDFRDALVIIGADDNVEILLRYNGQNKTLIAAQAFAKLTIVAQALNEGWTPDWSNQNQVKYYPWMKYSVGSGFSFHDCGYVGTHARVGSRLCFKSEELAKYAGTQFKDLYNDLMAL